MTFRVEDWDFRTALHIEIDSRHLTEFPQGIANSSRQNLPDCLFVLKLDLSLSRMDISAGSTSK